MTVSIEPSFSTKSIVKILSCTELEKNSTSKVAVSSGYNNIELPIRLNHVPDGAFGLPKPY